MNSRNKKLLLVLIVLMLFVSIGKETYALFTSSVSSTIQSYGTGTLKLSYSSSTINLNNSYPMSDSDGMNMGSGIITITNTGTLAYKFDVKIDVSSSSTLSNDLIKVSVDEQNPAFLSSDNNVIIRDIILNPGSSRSFSLKLWIDSSAVSSQVLGKKFVGNLTSSGIAVRNVDDSVGTVVGAGTYEIVDSSKYTVSNDETWPFIYNSTSGIWKSNVLEGDVENYIELSGFESGSYRLEISVYNDSSEDDVSVVLDRKIVWSNAKTSSGTISFDLTSTSVIGIDYLKFSQSTDGSDYIQFVLKKKV